MKVVAAFVVNSMFNFVIGLLVAKFLAPEEYGRFALSLAISIVVQTALFDWIRLAAVRFYSARARVEQPQIRATLDYAFAAIASLLGLAIIAILMSGFELTLDIRLIALAIGVAVTNGLFDFNAALVRARFRDGLYGRLIITKNVLALGLTAGGALVFHSAYAALIGVCFSMAGSLLVTRDTLDDSTAPKGPAKRTVAMSLMRYSLPIVTANVLYQMIPLANRSAVTHLFGFAETGQFSLAYDIGVRLVSAIGAALDVVLFQIAVLVDATHGPARGRAQVARNMTIVFSIVMPTCTGLWLTLPSAELVLVPAQFQGAFAHYLALLTPGLFAYAMINFAIYPIYQISKQTVPLIAAALVACLADPLLVLILPRSADASSLAVAQSGAMIAALVCLVGYASRLDCQWPAWRDIAAIMLASGAMTAALLPLRGLDPGPVVLATQILLGAAIYAMVALGLDVAGTRTLLIEQLRKKAWRSDPALGEHHDL